MSALPEASESAADETAAAASLRLDDALLVYQVGPVKARLLPALERVGEGGALTLSCDALAELDGAGLQLLVEAAGVLQARRARLRLEDLPDAVAALIRLGGFADRFDFVRSAR